MFRTMGKKLIADAIWRLIVGDSKQQQSTTGEICWFLRKLIALSLPSISHSGSYIKLLGWYDSVAVIWPIKDTQDIKGVHMCWIIKLGQPPSVGLFSVSVPCRRFFSTNLSQIWPKPRLIMLLGLVVLPCSSPQLKDLFSNTFQTGTSHNSAVCSPFIAAVLRCFEHSRWSDGHHATGRGRLP